jgi:hypothetical protein
MVIVLRAPGIGAGLIITDNKRSSDRKSNTWSQNISFLSDLSDLSDFEFFEVNMIIPDNTG